VEHWEKQRDGTISVHVRGTLDDIEIGLIIDILPEWRQQDVAGKDLVLYWGKARYRSLGKPSDRFLNVLVENDPKYRVPIVAALDGG
jgi:hypothetical protein